MDNTTRIREWCGSSEALKETEEENCRCGYQRQESYRTSQNRELTDSDVVRESKRKLKDGEKSPRNEIHRSTPEEL